MGTKLYLPFREVKFFMETEGEEPGTFQGHLAYFDNVDYGEDIVEKGAFQKSVDEWKKKQRETGTPFIFPLTWNHNPDHVLGGFKDIWEDDEGLAVKALLDLDTKDGAEKYSGLKKGYLRGLSIDYKPRKGGATYERNLRRLKDIDLIGGALVTHPMNPKAVVDPHSIKMTEEGWEDLEQKTVSGRMDWPLAARTRSWNASEAEQRLRTWASDKDGNLIPSRYRSVHFYYDASADPENFGSYKLPFCDVVGGTVQAVPRAIMAVAGGHGVNQAQIPESEKAGVRRKVNHYYARMRDEFQDDSIVSPFAGGKMSTNIVEEFLKVITGKTQEEKQASLSTLVPPVGTGGYQPGHLTNLHNMMMNHIGNSMMVQMGVMLLKSIFASMTHAFAQSLGGRPGQGAKDYDPSGGSYGMASSPNDMNQMMIEFASNFQTFQQFVDSLSPGQRAQMQQSLEQQARNDYEAIKGYMDMWSWGGEKAVPADPTASRKVLLDRAKKMHDPNLTQALLGMNQVDTRSMIDVCNMDLADIFQNSFVKMQVMNAFHCAMMKVLQVLEQNGVLTMTPQDYQMESMMGPMNMSASTPPYMTKSRKNGETGGTYSFGDIDQAIRDLYQWLQDFLQGKSSFEEFQQRGGAPADIIRGDNLFGTQFGSRDLRDVLHKAKEEDTSGVDAMLKELHEEKGGEASEESVDIDKLIEELKASVKQ